MQGIGLQYRARAIEAGCRQWSIRVMVSSQRRLERLVAFEKSGNDEANNRSPSQGWCPAAQVWQLWKQDDSISSTFSTLMAWSARLGKVDSAVQWRRTELGKLSDHVQDRLTRLQVRNSSFYYIPL